MRYFGGKSKICQEIASLINDVIANGKNLEVNNMQYFGGKSKVCQDIAQTLSGLLGDKPCYIEPFVGAGWVAQHVKSENKILCDKNEYLIAMYQEIQNGWLPPTVCTVEEYQELKKTLEPKHLAGFIGFACSFAGKWFGGYARDKAGDNNASSYCKRGHNSIMKKFANLTANTTGDIKFQCVDYTELKPENAVIYCDPPYNTTTQYGAVGKFDSEQFWDVMREWSKSNVVIISEYQAPDDFVCIKQFEVKLAIRNKNQECEPRVEKLFVHESLVDKLEV